MSGAGTAASSGGPTAGASGAAGALGSWGAGVAGVAGAAARGRAASPRKGVAPAAPGSGPLLLEPPRP